MIAAPHPESRAVCSASGLAIAMCLPELDPLRRMLQDGTVTDGTYIVQGYLAVGLQARGHRLTFVAQRDLDGVEIDRGDGAPTHVERAWSASSAFRLASTVAWRTQRFLGVPYLNVFSNLRALDACLRCLPGHDVVYERNALYSAAVAGACKRLGLPYVVFFDADQLLEHEVMGRPIRGLLRWRAARLLRYNLRVADRVVCVSEAARAHLLNAWGGDPARTVVCRNGVEVSRFRPDPQARADVRSRLGIGESPLIVFVGSFFEWHDVAILIDAFARVRAGVPGARLALVGQGRQLDSLKARAVALGMDDAVHFTGLVAHGEVPRLLAAADVAVAPYPAMDRDLWLSPLKLFEYMACGLAVVASAAGQVREVIQDGRNGLLVPPGDQPAMVTALQRLVADPALRAVLGGRAREEAVSEFSWDRYIDRLESVFEEAIASRSAAQR